jgi:hypothetical protein
MKQLKAYLQTVLDEKFAAKPSPSLGYGNAGASLAAKART